MSAAVNSPPLQWDAMCALARTDCGFVDQLATSSVVGGVRAAKFEEIESCKGRLLQFNYVTAEVAISRYVERDRLGLRMRCVVRVSASTTLPPGDEDDYGSRGSSSAPNRGCLGLEEF